MLCCCWLFNSTGFGDFNAAEAAVVAPPGGSEWSKSLLLPDSDSFLGRSIRIFRRALVLTLLLLLLSAPVTLDRAATLTAWTAALTSA